MMRTIQPISPRYDHWFADVELAEGKRGTRVVGALRRHQNVQRERFDVALASDGTFKVDIGTGSGVKLHFRYS